MCANGSNALVKHSQRCPAHSGSAAASLANSMGHRAPPELVAGGMLVSSSKHERIGRGRISCFPTSGCTSASHSGLPRYASNNLLDRDGGGRDGHQDSTAEDRHRIARASNGVQVPRQSDRSGEWPGHRSRCAGKHILWVYLTPLRGVGHALERNARPGFRRSG